MASSPTRNIRPNARAHGARARRDATTRPATAAIVRSRTGLVVRIAAIASPSAHNHQAPGCSSRGDGALTSVRPQSAR